LNALTAAARTTPGRLGLIMVALLVLTVAFGAASAAGLQAKSAALTELVTSSEPLAVAAQDIYRSLSDADATAASAFLEGGRESAEARQRYGSDVAQAGAALANAATAAGSSAQASRSIAILSTNLPVYTGLVETARANNRQGLPVGAAYLREASGLMRSTLLPAARQLYESETARLASTQARATPLPIIEMLLGLATIGCLVAAQVFLTRRTNRVLNVGLVVATAAGAVALIWVVVTVANVWINVEQGRQHGSAQVQQLAAARIAALEARGDETLTLVARGAGAAYERHFVEVSNRLAGESGDAGLLGEARDATADPAVRAVIEEAIEQQRAWRTAHAEIRRLDDSGQYNQAVRLTISDTEPGGASPAFRALDESLARAIQLSKERFDAEVASARGAVAWSVLLVALLTVVAAVGSVWGIWQRLKEYR
jgi:hypothetical protein